MMEQLPLPFPDQPRQANICGSAPVGLFTQEAVNRQLQGAPNVDRNHPVSRLQGTQAPRVETVPQVPFRGTLDEEVSGATYTFWRNQTPETTAALIYNTARDLEVYSPSQRQAPESFAISDETIERAFFEASLRLDRQGTSPSVPGTAVSESTLSGLPETHRPPARPNPHPERTRPRRRRVRHQTQER